MITAPQQGGARACDACGHPARPGDPLINVRAGHDTATIHRSHTVDRDSGFYRAEEVTR